MLAGVRTARGTPFVIPLFLLVAMVELTYGAQTVQPVVDAERSLDLGACGYGLLLAGSGAGGLISAVFNGQLTTARRLTLWSSARARWRAAANWSSPAAPGWRSRSRRPWSAAPRSSPAR